MYLVSFALATTPLDAMCSTLHSFEQYFDCPCFLVYVLLQLRQLLVFATLFFRYLILSLHLLEHAIELVLLGMNGVLQIVQFSVGLLKLEKHAELSTVISISLLD
ncbi:hypothetical protein RAN67_04340 [Acinetobacter baumannii]|uniref:hypothetical protein n=1 Tax=Acinetobacter baumannii TaxID=470 RepID=UPI001A9179A2|nr:hypothetical protein [Acinetobacter baumannii]MBO0669050.1 hypothetical protein [Acinetobacter baumannii]MDI7697285.1 hypothetical protein [Acinetobacter baumannii]MDP8557636.1 hypothetical protein [Acinetobacter baumannii]